MHASASATGAPKRNAAFAALQRARRHFEVSHRGSQHELAKDRDPIYGFDYLCCI